MGEQNPAELAKSGWEGWANHTTTVLAVIAALSSGFWGASNLHAILKQGQVNDAWAYYQAKSMKEHQAEQTRDLATALAKGESPDRAATFAALANKLAAAAEKETADSLQQRQQAVAFQQSRDKIVEASFWYEISFAALQLGVILATIAVGAKRKSAWTAALVCGILGLIILLNGVLHFYPAPRSWYQSTSQEMGNDG